MLPEKGGGAPKAGPGTCIVEALSKNLLSEIEVSYAAAGTAVTIRHPDDANIKNTLSAVV